MVGKARKQVAVGEKTLLPPSTLRRSTGRGLKKRGGIFSVLDTGHEKLVRKSCSAEYSCAAHFSCFFCSLKTDSDLASLVVECESFLDRSPDIRSNLEYI